MAKTTTTQDFKRQMVELANANNERLTGDMDEIWKIINSNEVVVGIWQDAGEPDGVGMMILKGAALVRKTAEGLVSVDARVSAISCIEAAQAQALANLIGEKDSRH